MQFQKPNEILLKINFKNLINIDLAVNKTKLYSVIHNIYDHPNTRSYFLSLFYEL